METQHSYNEEAGIQELDQTGSGAFRVMRPLESPYNAEDEVVLQTAIPELGVTAEEVKAGIQVSICPSSLVGKEVLIIQIFAQKGDNRLGHETALNKNDPEYKRIMALYRTKKVEKMDSEERKAKKLSPAKECYYDDVYEAVCSQSVPELGVTQEYAEAGVKVALHTAPSTELLVAQVYQEIAGENGTDRIGTERAFNSNDPEFIALSAILRNAKREYHEARYPDVRELMDIIWLKARGVVDDLTDRRIARLKKKLGYGKQAEAQQ